MVFLRCSSCANVLPAPDDASENRFCSRCRAVTHMPKLDASAWDYAGVTPLHAALTREAPADVALQVGGSCGAAPALAAFVHYIFVTLCALWTIIYL
jgi:LSD1 subclass zinc finger protein